MAVKKNYHWQRSFFAAITFSVDEFNLASIKEKVEYGQHIDGD